MGAIRSRTDAGFILPCGHRNVRFDEDEDGKFYVCYLDHKTYMKDLVPEVKPDLMYR